MNTKTAPWFLCGAAVATFAAHVCNVTPTSVHAAGIAVAALLAVVFDIVKTVRKETL